MRCSKGTYIRTLAEDIGAALGCGAHLRALRRTGSGALDAATTRITLDELAALTKPSATRCCCRADALLADWPAVRLPTTKPAASSPACAAASTLPDAPRGARLRPRAAAPSSAAPTSRPAN